MLSCRTIEPVRPPRPEREKIEMPKEEISPAVAKIKVYYALLVEDWEKRENLIEGKK